MQDPGETNERAKLSQTPTDYPPPEYSAAAAEEGGIEPEGDDFNYGYNFEFTEKSIRLGMLILDSGSGLLLSTVTTFVTVKTFVIFFTTSSRMHHFRFIAAKPFMSTTVVCLT